jgi:hypothetical protein
VSFGLVATAPFVQGPGSVVVVLEEVEVVLLDVGVVDVLLLVVEDVLVEVVVVGGGTHVPAASQVPLGQGSLRKGGRLVDAPGRWLAGTKSEYPVRASYRPIQSVSMIAVRDVRATADWYCRLLQC